MGQLSKLRSDDKGATAVEYGLILALVVLAMLTALRGVASTTINMWNYVDNTVLSAN
ncbi:MAG TPA: Flp family type IVb pilin [Allosphingosinicella sp.]|nr:Flp family type IVb pilin [Allosphingosinicella sp.]HKT15435.1 Flp family type IVb pilin [Allosphingosinicella sp.]